MENTDLKDKLIVVTGGGARNGAGHLSAGCSTRA